jgi:hypothetical protein
MHVECDWCSTQRSRLHALPWLLQPTPKKLHHRPEGMQRQFDLSFFELTVQGLSIILGINAQAKGSGATERRDGFWPVVGRRPIGRPTSSATTICSSEQTPMQNNRTSVCVRKCVAHHLRDWPRKCNTQSKMRPTKCPWQYDTPRNQRRA